MTKVRVFGAVPGVGKTSNSNFATNQTTNCTEVKDFCSYIGCTNFSKLLADKIASQMIRLLLI